MLTRRQFLVGAATVLAGATGCRAGLQAAPDREVPAGGGPTRIALLSDTHVQDASSLSAVAVNGKLSRAVADLKELKPALWVVTGDVTDHGLPGEYSAFRKIADTAAPAEQWLVTTGNHEFYDKTASDEVALDRFRKAFGQKQPYSSRVLGEIHFVMLADEQWKTAPKNPDWAWLTPEQLRWFDQVLSEHRDKLTVVGLHQPLQETVLWTGGGNNFAGSGQVDELRAILKRNPQVRLWLSGHTHLRCETPGQVVKQGGVTYMCLGSTFYQFYPSNREEDQGDWPEAGGFRRDLSANQSRVMEVWPDRVVIRLRDHARRIWQEGQDVEIKRT